MAKIMNDIGPAHRLTIVAWAGDFREADLRLASGSPENYRGQRYTQDYLNGLAPRVEQLTYITGQTDIAYDERLPSGVHAIGAGFQGGFDHAALVRLVERSAPDTLILRTPSRPLMRWARRNGVRTMLLIADSFAGTSLKARLARWMMVSLMRNRHFDVVANHGRRSAQQLVDFGVPAAKVLAWDYPAFDTPAARPPKTQASLAPLKLFYAGLLASSKGVTDLLEAVAQLRDQGMVPALSLAGRIPDDMVAREVQRLDLTGHVTLLGMIPNDGVIAAMAQADMVVVPSRHDYPEGMPLTIYEALCSRTPLIVSDHPMFVDNVVHGESGLIFPAGDAGALADAILLLARDPALYAHLSLNGAAAWERLQIPVEWHALIDAWVANDADGRAWIESACVGM